MKDMGFGVIDRYTVIVVLLVMVLAQVLFGYQIPIDTSNASQLFIDLILLTGYLYLARSIYRLPVAATASFIIFKNVVYLRVIDLDKEFASVWEKRYKRIAFRVYLIVGSLIFTLFGLPLSIFSFGIWTQEGKLPPFFEKFQQGFRRNILELLDRIGVILIAILATLPSFHPYVRLLGIIGISLMVVLFAFRGHFTALIRDAIEKEINTGDKDKLDSDERAIQDLDEDKIALSSVRTRTQKGIKCKVCGKFCTRDGRGNLPKYCSLECRQKGYVLWDKDWCIGHRQERKLINRLRNVGYSNTEANKNIIEDLGKIKSTSSVWALLGIIHDGDQFSFDYNVKNSIRNIDGTIAITELIEAIADDNDDVSQIAIELLGDFSKDHTMVTVAELDLVGALRRESVGVRLAAIETLGNIGGEIAIRGLLNHLGNGKDPREDTFIINAFERIGKSAIPALKEAMYYRAISKEAIQALKRVSPDTLAELEEEVNRDRIRCQSCGHYIKLTFPKSKMVSEYGRSTLFSKFKRKWDFEIKCTECGKEMGVVLVEVTEFYEKLWGVSMTDSKREEVRRMRNLNLLLNDEEKELSQKIRKRYDHLRPKNTIDEDAI